MQRTLAALLSLLLLNLALVTPVAAGQTCTEKALTPDVARKALTMALKTRDQLDNSGANLVLLGRVGSDLSKYGLRYSHLGIIWREHPKGRWLVVHLLNQCGTASSTLYDEGLGNFFLDDMFTFEALLIIPYSLIASPWATLYQNSNQWPLELVAAALATDDTVHDRSQAQQWLKEHDYVPTALPISSLERLGARVFSANVQFDDHSSEERRKGRYNAVTVESVRQFIVKTDPETVQQVVTLDDL